MVFVVSWKTILCEQSELRPGFVNFSASRFPVLFSGGIGDPLEIVRRSTLEVCPQRSLSDGSLTLRTCKVKSFSLLLTYWLVC